MDSAFNFLETYSVKEETTEHNMAMEGDNMKSYSRYLNTQQENNQEGIPRWVDKVQKDHHHALIQILWGGMGNNF